MGGKARLGHKAALPRAALCPAGWPGTPALAQDLHPLPATGSGLKGSGGSGRRSL